MEQSRGKYDEYCKKINELLEKPKHTEIQLAATRHFDEIRISASSQLITDAEAGFPNNTDQTTSKLRFRLALVEKEIKYAGTNRIRFHHHVVRALPGGPEGVILTDGNASISMHIHIDEIRKELKNALVDYAKLGQGFSNNYPSLELSDLAIIAFVQDDVSREIHHAVIQSVDETPQPKAKASGSPPEGD